MWSEMMDRREFIKLMASAAVVTAGSRLFSDEAKGSKEVKVNVPERNRRPYSNVDWGHSYQIHTTTHGHCPNQARLNAYLERGFGLLTLSNYYPSASYWPASKMTVNYYRVHHDFPVMVNGVRTDGPFDWNKILAPWIDEVDEQYRKQYPFVEARMAKHPAFAGRKTISAIEG